MNTFYQEPASGQLANESSFRLYPGELMKMLRQDKYIGAVITSLVGLWIITGTLVVLLFVSPATVQPVEPIVATGIIPSNAAEMVFYNKKAFISHFADQYPVAELEPAYEKMQKTEGQPVFVRKRATTQARSFSEAFDIRPVSDN